MISSPPLRIGTRSSPLALFQARAVSHALEAINIKSEIIKISSEGDADLTTPLYEMGIQGIFTKTLDAALLDKKIDLAVHSAKDMPTRQAYGLVMAAVLERSTAYDCLVLPRGSSSVDLADRCIIGSSSLRRKLQWINRFPHHQVENLRGNIQTRLERVDTSGWQGAIFAQAALERLKIESHTIITLDWMLPSPAQGAIAAVCRADDTAAWEACRAINHRETETCISMERDFLAALHGGCAVPIAAYAKMEGSNIRFMCNVMSLDAHVKCETDLLIRQADAKMAGRWAADKIRSLGADMIIKSFRPYEGENQTSEPKFYVQE